METLKFKTNLKCSGCIAAITPELNSQPGIASWEVDLQSPDRVLTVTAKEDISEDDVIRALAKTGYTAEKLGTV